MSIALAISTLMAALALAGFVRQWWRDRHKDEQEEQEREQGFAAVVNQRLTALLDGYSAVFDEYESRARELLGRIAALTQERDHLAGRVSDLERQGREDRTTIERLTSELERMRTTVDRLTAELEQLRQANGAG